MVDKRRKTSEKKLVKFWKNGKNAENAKIMEKWKLQQTKVCGFYRYDPDLLRLKVLAIL